VARNRLPATATGRRLGCGMPSVRSGQRTGPQGRVLAKDPRGTSTKRVPRGVTNPRHHTEPSRSLCSVGTRFARPPTLKGFARRHWIKIERGSISVISPAALRAAALDGSSASSRTVGAARSASRSAPRNAYIW
jgi:hypothetical protein